ncbi:hypothetical protein PGT21_004651 [Puccinia graminis f. sp. tritici]|uniref:Uncharacterized protein n=1 Tax=Puccinia graminis f. sp. tritici TaxID=56615 RepID=A0A5B0Q4T4_PUCGR|nr:hypothetical protein PGT21_004651 [Puccinia graminis f. sp. tritici]
MFMSGGEPVTGPLEPARHYIWGPEVGRLKSQLSPTSASADTYPSPANQHPSQLLNHTTDHRSTDPLIINYHLDHWSGQNPQVQLTRPQISSALSSNPLSLRKDLPEFLSLLLRKDLPEFSFVRLKNLFRSIDDSNPLSLRKDSPEFLTLSLRKASVQINRRQQSTLVKKICSDQSTI